jgi:hypothetical protein
VLNVLPEVLIIQDHHLQVKEKVAVPRKKEGTKYSIKNTN